YSYLISFISYLKQMSLGQKSLWIFAPGSKPDNRREQNQHYALLGAKRFCPDLDFNYSNGLF
ncbi:hypothetical protein, partial [Enterococcus faecalis]|uniref:hypothetical protein n=1 Tax=Enterococcus faecalis TaxID=1351 RepID=UPI001F190EA6